MVRQYTVRNKVPHSDFQEADTKIFISRRAPNDCYMQFKDSQNKQEIQIRLKQVSFKIIYICSFHSLELYVNDYEIS